MRVALTIAYNGTSYLGSQKQKESPNTIFGILEKALLKINIEYNIIASGRTDRGVHATGQVCHIDIPLFWSDLAKFKRVLNSMIPTSIVIKKVVEVSDDFHARYSAKKRVYRYIIKEQISNPFEADVVTFLTSIDEEQIRENISLFIGEHNFKNFMKSGSDVNSTTRVIYRAFVYEKNGYTILHFEANGFLRSQIRLMVGAILSLDSQQIREQLSCKKCYKIKPAPCNGLYLAKIKY